MLPIDPMLPISPFLPLPRRQGMPAKRNAFSTCKPMS
jgi:hypothetical protein